MRNNLVLEIISAVLILLFCYTAFNKLANIEDFTFILGHMMWLKTSASTVAVVIPSSELLVSVLLIIPGTRKAGLWCSLLLLIMFTTYIGTMIVVDPNLPCSCGGVVSRLSWPQHLLFNAFFMIVAVAGILKSTSKSFIAIKTGQAENLSTE